jgi:arylsulfatase A-like enzyme/predicted Zn-dependent protease
MNRASRLLAAALAAISVAGCSPRRPRSVLWITMDTTRADFLGCYGKKSARTPNLDRLAAEGTLFLDAMTTVPITLPSHSTMFTGTYPLAHGVRDNSMFHLPESRTTLAEVLRERGFATGAAIGGFPLTRRSGIAQGFDFFDDHITIGLEDYKGDRIEGLKPSYFEERPAPRVNDALLPWLRSHARSPFFAWAHYWDPHHPHIPPPPFSDMYRQDLYQGEIAFVDQSLGVLLEALKKAGAYDSTLIVVCADHGEGRGEHHEETHSMLTYNSTLHVPLILRVPGEPAGRRVQARVGTVDVMPTILEFLGIKAPPGLQGRSLVPLMRSRDDGRREEASYYAETLSPRLSYGWGELRVLFEGPYKYVYGPRPEMFDLSRDPAEEHDLSKERPAETQRMEKILSAFLSKNASQTAGEAVREADDVTRERLAALGYLSPSGESPSATREELRSDGEAPQDRVEDVNLWTTVKERITEGDYLTAKEMGIDLVARDPQNGFYRGMLAMAYLGLGQDEAAAKVAEAGGKVVAANESVYQEVVRRLFNTGRRDRAMALAARIAAERPSAAAQYLIAEMRGRQGEREAMAEALREALRLDPKHASARMTLAIHLAENGDNAGAEREFKTLLADNPRHAPGHLNFGTFLLKNGRHDEGAAEIRRAVALAPTYWKAQLALLAALVDQGATAEAETVFRTLQEGCRDAATLDQARELMRNS